MTRWVIGTLLVAAHIDAWGATFTVTTLDDGGPGSLRAQIAAANSNANPGELDEIVFGVSGTIALQTELPDITQPVAIRGDGNVTLDGSAIDGSATGLRIVDTSDSVIEGMTVANFRSPGVPLMPGFTPPGSFGITIHGDSTGNLVAYNELEGNSVGIIVVDGPPDAGNRIVHNEIDTAGVAPWFFFFDGTTPYDTYGIAFVGASGNEASYNVIRHAYRAIAVLGNGVFLGMWVDSVANDNEVVSNHIETIGNQGVLIAFSASDNTVHLNDLIACGREAVEVIFGTHRNVISHNTISGSGANDPEVAAIVIIGLPLGGARENRVLYNRMDGVMSHGLAVGDNAQSNVFKGNTAEAAPPCIDEDPPGCSPPNRFAMICVGQDIFPQPEPTPALVAGNDVDQNVVSGFAGGLLLTGNCDANKFKMNVFGPQTGPVVALVDGNATDSMPDRAAEENEFEENTYVDTEDTVLWWFTEDTADNTVCEPDVAGGLDLAQHLVTPPGLGNTVDTDCSPVGRARPPSR